MAGLVDPLVVPGPAARLLNTVVAGRAEGVGGFEHQPVMVEEVLAGLRPQAGGRYVDCTVGGGGHAEAILRAGGATARVLGCDRDPAALEAAAARLGAYAGQWELRLGSFERLGEWLEAGSCDGAVADLGVSSHQFDSPERGFSFQVDGPLGMQMTPGEGPDAAELVNGLPVDELARLFEELGDERHARRIARAIGQERASQAIRTTRQLASLIERCVPRGGRKVHPATRVFQALRMAVNDELGGLERGLRAVWRVLKPSGRLVCITFHSGEARIVKRFGAERSRGYAAAEGVDIPELRRERPPLLRWVTRRPQVPGEAECGANPRARSAQVRVMEKLADESEGHESHHGEKP